MSLKWRHRITVLATVVSSESWHSALLLQPQCVLLAFSLRIPLRTSSGFNCNLAWRNYLLVSSAAWSDSYVLLPVYILCSNWLFPSKHEDINLAETMSLPLCNEQVAAYFTEFNSLFESVIYCMASTGGSKVGNCPKLPSCPQTNLFDNFLTSFAQGRINHGAKRATFVGLNTRNKIQLLGLGSLSLMIKYCFEICFGLRDTPLC